MNADRILWQKLLCIEAPWTVLDCRSDDLRRRCDVSIGVETPSAWFGLRRGKPQAAVRQMSLRHLNFGEWEVHVHIAAPANADLSMLNWGGEGDLPFTRALSQQVFAFLREGSSLQSICTLLNVPIAALWRFRYALDSGRWAAGDGAPGDGAPGDGAVPAPLRDPPNEAAPIARDLGATGSVPVAPEGAQRNTGDRGDAHNDGIPDITDPVWTGLIHGSHRIDVRVLGLKLLLSRLRAQFELISDDEVRILKLHELRRYFVKNRHLLAYELRQLDDTAS